MTDTIEYLNSTPREDITRPIEVGDVYAASWGYDQTNIDFYQCVGVTPSGKSVRVRKIGCIQVGGRVGWDHIVPVKDDFIGDTMTRRIRRYDYHPSISVASYATAHRTAWNVRHGQTAIGYGH
jgi:hypothetical protein